MTPEFRVNCTKILTVGDDGTFIENRSNRRMVEKVSMMGGKYVLYDDRFFSGLTFDVSKAVDFLEGKELVFNGK